MVAIRRASSSKGLSESLDCSSYSFDILEDFIKIDD